MQPVLVCAGACTSRVKYVFLASEVADKQARRLDCAAPPSSAALLAVGDPLPSAAAVKALLAAAPETPPVARAQPTPVSGKAARELGNELAVELLRQGAVGADPDPARCSSPIDVRSLGGPPPAADAPPPARVLDYVNYTPAEPGPGPLEARNSHPRDGLLRFVEATHEYYVRQPDGTERRTSGSVTYLAHCLETSPFDSCAAAQAMKASRNWPRLPYCEGMRAAPARFADMRGARALVFVDRHGAVLQQYPVAWQRIRRAAMVITAEGPMTTERLCADWAILGQRARNRGTEAHLQVERCLNGLACHADTPEMKSFATFMHAVAVPAGWEVFRTEWRIFCEDSNVAGSIDMVARAPDGTFVLVDWKRSDKVRTTVAGSKAPWDTTMQFPLDHMDEVAVATYALQLNLYKYILETKYDMVISAMVLSQIGPGNAFYTFVPPLPLESNYLMSMRRAEFAASQSAQDAGAASAAAQAECKAAQRALTRGRRPWDAMMPKGGITLDMHRDGACYRDAAPAAAVDAASTYFDM